ncbi:MAG: tetratricopeptide repeat protein [Thermoanaerobaculia bacterium]
MPLTQTADRACPGPEPCHPTPADTAAPGPFPTPSRRTPGDGSAGASGARSPGPTPLDGATAAPASRRELGRAHLWNGEPNRALEILAPLHRSRPRDREVHSLMLDALFLLGLDEGDFPWTVEPAVVRIGPALLDRLHELLRADGGQVSLLDLLVAVAEEGHPAFRSEELLDRLEQDERFAVRRVGLAPECSVVSPGR